MKSVIKDVAIVGGGAIGWVTAAALKKKHPDLNITLVESDTIPPIGVGESLVPPFKDLLDWIGLDENEWLKATHGIHKFGNHFVGWNTEKPMTRAADHWNADKKDYHFYTFSYTPRSDVLKKNYLNGINSDDYYYDNNGSFGVDAKLHDYWLYMVNQGQFKTEDTDSYTADSYYLAMTNKAARWNSNDQIVDHDYPYAWHMDAERFPKLVRDKIAIPLGVDWINDHVVDILKDQDGYVDKLILEKRGEVTADLFIDCSGFHRLIMKTMDVEWEPITQQPTQSAWVAPIKYNDPHNEMKPYTQSYAVKSGWNFIITLYSRMGSGYVFDSESEDPDKAREDFIKYWDGYEFIRDPRLIQWEQGCYKSLWEKNVVGIGMAQGFIDPMEANIIFMAQTSLQLIDAALRKYKQRVIPPITKKSFTKEIHRVRDQIDDFIAFHYGLSKRRDTPFWQKWGEYGLQNNQPTRNWNEYKRSNNYLGRSFFIDTQYADQQMYLDQEIDVSSLDIDPKLLPLAKIDYEYRRKKNQEIAKLAPNVYDWSRQYLHDGATHQEILEQALAER